MSTRFQTAFLDAGGVLVHPNWQRAADALARHGVFVEPGALADAEPAVKRSLDVAPTVRATNDSQRGFLYFDLILKGAGITRSDATDAALAELKAFNDIDGAWDVIFPDAVTTLVRLREAGLRIVVVSNSNGTLRRLFERIGLALHVDLLIDSTEEHVEKPDPRLFEIALARSGADRTTTIHCGDLYEIDVVGARAAGLPAVLVDTAGIYGMIDCPRVRSLTEYADGLVSGRFD
jgi:HAD superfamily hydrolase (TIGR01549 family)